MWLSIIDNILVQFYDRLIDFNFKLILYKKEILKEYKKYKYS